MRTQKKNNKKTRNNAHTYKNNQTMKKKENKEGRKMLLKSVSLLSLVDIGLTEPRFMLINSSKPATDIW